MIDTAILLAAGQGTRLGAVSLSKPLCPVDGKSLVDHAIERLSAAGLRRAVVVTGYRAEEIEAHLQARRYPIRIETVRTPDWRQPNGVSALAAAGCVDAHGALLAMCDHLVDPALYARIAEKGAGPGLRLGIDRRLGHPWIDPDDVTCVATRDEKIVAIGKGMNPHDAYDTGVFAISAAFFTALRALPSPSITEAVRLLARTQSAEVIECSDLDWIDVDDPRALKQAEAWVGQRLSQAS